MADNMRQAIFGCFLIAGLASASSVSAQSTISDRPWEITSTKGVWTALLPAYELGTNANGAPAFRDNLDDVGYFSEWKLVRRFLGTRTTFETRGYYAFAESINRTDPINVDVPNPSTGISFLGTGADTRLKSKIGHYGFDAALRDTWRTDYGGLSAGAGFSYMAFDQKFDVDYGPQQLMQEKLDTDYVGGKIFCGWDGCLGGRASNLDLAIGYYNLDADYRFIEQTLTGGFDQEVSRMATTFETTFTTRKEICGYRCGLSLGALYISDMPTIKHNQGAPVSFGSDDAVTLTILLECLL